MSSKKRAADLPSRARKPSTPGKLTPEVIAGICERIAGGQPRNAACAAFDVSDRALRLYRDAHADVDEQLELAEARGAEWYRQQIQTCPAGKDAADDWKRWAWLGERIHPATLSPPKQRVETSGPGGGAQEIKHSGAIAVDLTGAMRIARSNGESK